MHTATTITHELLWQASHARLSVTPLQLQKLLFLVQVEHLRATGDLAFRDHVVAWKMGPVVRSVYEVFRGRRSALAAPTRRPAVSESARAAVAQVLHEHGHKSGADLVRLTHRRGGAWLATPRDDVIQPEALASRELTADDRARLGSRRQVKTDEEELVALSASLERSPPSGETVAVVGDLFAHFGLRRA